MKLSEILNVDTDYNQPFIITKEYQNFVFTVAKKERSIDTTERYLNCEVIKIHSTSYGDIVIKVA